MRIKISPCAVKLKDFFFFLLLTLLFCELDYKLHPTMLSVFLCKAVYTQAMASTEVDRSCSEN